MSPEPDFELSDTPTQPVKRVRRPVAPPTDPPFIPVGVQFETDPAALVMSLLGRPVESGLLAAMANAPSGADAFIAVGPADGGFEARTSFIGGHASRVFLHHSIDNVLEAQNWDFRLYDVESFEGAGDWRPENEAFDGTELFTNQVRALRQVGFRRIWTIAARNEHKDRNKRQVGYCVWPKMGFDASIPDSVWVSLPQQYRDQVLTNQVGSRWPRSLLALVTTFEGSEWWKTHGVGLECVFDLDTDSTSMRVLAAYVARRTGEGETARR